MSFREQMPAWYSGLTRSQSTGFLSVATTYTWRKAWSRIAPGGRIALPLGSETTSPLWRRAGPRVVEPQHCDADGVSQRSVTIAAMTAALASTSRRNWAVATSASDQGRVKTR